MSMKLKTALKKAAMLIHENDFCRYRFESYDGKSFCALGAIKNTDYDAFMWLSYATHKGLQMFNDNDANDKHEVASILMSLSEEM